MRIVRNEGRIRVSSGIGRYGIIAGLVVLLGGMVLSWVRPQWSFASLITLPLGFTFTVIGGLFADRYSSPLAHHETLAAALKGLDNNHVLLQYTLPASQVLLEPSGCTVFVVKTDGGQVIYKDGRWKHNQRGRFFRQLVGQETLGIPDFEAERQAQKLERWLARRLPGVEVPIRAVIVFVNPNVTLEAEDAPLPVFHAKKIKAWLRGPGKLRPLPDDRFRQLAEALGAGTTTD